MQLNWKRSLCGWAGFAGVEDEGDGAVVEDVDLHVRAEAAGFDRDTGVADELDKGGEVGCAFFGVGGRVE